MSLTRRAKLAILHGCRFAGLTRLVLDSRWRQHRLAILCWHNIAIDDEHLWSPDLCLTPATFRARLELLRSLRCNVLPLNTALERLRAGTLPPRAVALTIDDGDSSIYSIAWPMLRQFGYPATLYWTTYYSVKPYAVFDTMLSYLLWAGRSKRLVLGEPAVDCDLSNPAERAQANQAIYAYSRTNRWTADRKEQYLEALAKSLDIDYLELKRRRILHMITPAEAAEMRAEGLDLQLHTHRHRVPKDPIEFAREIADNAEVICATGAANPCHFCYPSGSFIPEFADWLQRNNVQSATTVQAGLVGRQTNWYFLPRVVDQETQSATEFEAGLSGIASWMVRRHPVDQHGFR